MRIRACGLLIRDGRVLLQREMTDTFWALPGGKAEPGETPEAALRREFREELGWDVAVGPLLWRLENAFTHRGVEVRQDEHYFAVHCESKLERPKEDALQFRWASLLEAIGLDVRPAAIKDVLVNKVLL